MRDLQSIEEFKAIKLTENVVFLFTASWCPDCHFIDPFMNNIEEKFNEDFTFISINRDQFIDLCAELDIYGIPSFLAYKNGLEVGRLVSKNRKTQEEIEYFLSEIV